MSASTEIVNTEQLIVKKVKTLSLATQQEVLDFVEFLQTKQQQNQSATQNFSAMSSRSLIDK